MKFILTFLLLSPLIGAVGSAAVTSKYDENVSGEKENSRQPETEGYVNEDALFDDGAALPLPPSIVKKDIGNSSGVGLFDNTNGDGAINNSKAKKTNVAP